MAARQVATVRRATPASAPRPSLDADVLRRRRMRRTRLGASLLLVAATVAIGIQGVLIATTGMSLGAFFVMVAAVTAGGSAIAVQRRLDTLSMPRVAARPRRRDAVQVHDLEAETPRAQPAPWTPTAMPRPLYLSRPA